MEQSHAFAISAYGCSPYLSSCIESILEQTRSPEYLVLTTSTPSPFLEEMADRYGIELKVNPIRIDIASDWNFALSACDTDLVTIAHQDDTYGAVYGQAIRDAVARHPDCLIAFTNYVEHTATGSRPTNLNLRIKRVMCRRAFATSEAIDGTNAKRRFLAFGNPVCCPSVVINRRLLPDFRFAGGMKTNLDWEAWGRMAHMRGAFVYINQALLSKGVHAASETSATIASKAREFEDRLMFEKFWPAPMAALLLAAYRLGYLANRV